MEKVDKLIEVLAEYLQDEAIIQLEDYAEIVKALAMLIEARAYSN